jgi:hypothetical protein
MNTHSILRWPWTVTALIALGLTLGVARCEGSGPHPFTTTAATTVTAVTQIHNRPDSGANGNWAFDNFARTLTVTPGAGCGTAPASGYACYDATITDTGTFTTRPNQYTPDQDGPYAGEHIVSPAVTGPMHGTASYQFWANTTPDAANVPAYENDHYAVPSGDHTTPLWPELAFPVDTGFAGLPMIQNTWSWTYFSGCEQWTDSAANGSGDVFGDGNITGARCVALPDLLYVRVKTANAELAALGLHARWVPALSLRIAGRPYNVKPPVQDGMVPAGSTVNLRDGLVVHVR